MPQATQSRWTRTQPAAELLRQRLRMQPRGELTVAHVYERLRVTGCGEDVMVFLKTHNKTGEEGTADTPPVVKQEIGVADATGGSQPSAYGYGWRIVKLVSVCLPEAVVELTVGDDSERFTVDADELRAASKAPDVKNSPSSFTRACKTLARLWMDTITIPASSRSPERLPNICLYGRMQLPLHDWSV